MNLSPTKSVKTDRSHSLDDSVISFKPNTNPLSQTSFKVDVNISKTETKKNAKVFDNKNDSRFQHVSNKVPVIPNKKILFQEHFLKKNFNHSIDFKRIYIYNTKSK